AKEYQAERRKRIKAYKDYAEEKLEQINDILATKEYSFEVEHPYRGDFYQYEPNEDATNYDRLQLAKKKFEHILEMPYDADDESWVSLLGEGIADNSGKTILFLSGLINIAENFEVLEAFEEVEKSEETKMLLEAVGEEYRQQSDPFLKQPQSYRVGTMIAENIPYILEYLTTAGGANLARKAAEKAMIKTIAKKAKNKAIKNIAKRVVKPAGLLVAGLTQTGMNPIQLTKNVSDRVLPQYVQFENMMDGETGMPSYTLADGEDFGEAFAKGLGITVSEFVTERFGEALVSNKFLKNATLQEWAKRRGLNTKNAFQKAFDKAGYHGVLAETWVEEYPNRILNTIITGDQSITDVLNPIDEEMIDTFYSMLAFSAGRNASAAYGLGKDLTEEYKVNRGFENPQYLWKGQKTTREQVVQAIEEGRIDEVQVMNDPALEAQLMDKYQEINAQKQERPEGEVSKKNQKTIDAYQDRVKAEEEAKAHVEKIKQEKSIPESFKGTKVKSPVFHTTTDDFSFEDYDPEKGTGMDNTKGDRSAGIHFHDARGEFADDSFTAPTKKKTVWLDIKNPATNVDPHHLTKKDIEELKAQGYDGVISEGEHMFDSDKEYTEYVVFDKSQVKEINTETVSPNKKVKKTGNIHTYRSTKDIIKSEREFDQEEESATKKEKDAIQERETEEMDVGEQTKSGEGVRQEGKEKQPIQQQEKESEQVEDQEGQQVEDFDQIVESNREKAKVEVKPQKRRSNRDYDAKVDGLGKRKGESTYGTGDYAVDEEKYEKGSKRRLTSPNGSVFINVKDNEGNTVGLTYNIAAKDKSKYEGMNNQQINEMIDKEISESKERNKKAAKAKSEKESAKKKEEKSDSARKAEKKEEKSDSARKAEKKSKKPKTKQKPVKKQEKAEKAIADAQKKMQDIQDDESMTDEEKNTAMEVVVNDLQIAMQELKNAEDAVEKEKGKEEVEKYGNEHDKVEEKSTSDAMANKEQAEKDHDEKLNALRDINIAISEKTKQATEARKKGDEEKADSLSGEIITLRMKRDAAKEDLAIAKKALADAVADATLRSPEESATQAQSKRNHKKLEETREKGTDKTTKSRQRTNSQRISPDDVPIQPLSDREMEQRRKDGRVLPTYKQIVKSLAAVLRVSKKTKKNLRGLAGLYNVNFQEIVTAFNHDLKTLAHEAGHRLSDRFKLLQSTRGLSALTATNYFNDKGEVISKEEYRKNKDKEGYHTESVYDLHKYGSKPKSVWSDEKKEKYRQEEAVGEFVRLWITNPYEAKRRYPAFHDHFINTLSESDLKEKSSKLLSGKKPRSTAEELLRIGEDIRALYYAAGVDQIIANTDLSEGAKKEYTRYVGEYEAHVYKITPWDRLNFHIFNDMAPFNKIVMYAAKAQGIDLDDIKNISKDPRITAILLRGNSSKMDDLLDNGMTFFNTFSRRHFSDGDVANVENLLRHFDHSSEAAFKEDKATSVAFAIARRVMELATREFDKMENGKEYGWVVDEIAWEMQQENFEKTGEYRVDPEKLGKRMADRFSMEEYGMTFEQIKSLRDAARKDFNRLNRKVKKGEELTKKQFEALKEAEKKKEELDAQVSAVNSRKNMVIAREEKVYHGAGAGNMNDLDNARRTHFKDREDLRKQDPERLKNLEMAAQKYKEFSDMLLQYAVAGGTLKQAEYDESDPDNPVLIGGYEYIKERNEHYVAMNRIMEDNAEEFTLSDLVTRPPNENLKTMFHTFDDKDKSTIRGANKSKQKGLIKPFKGSDLQIRDPYVSLINNAYRTIQETDRNFMKQQLMQLMAFEREIGDGKETDVPMGEFISPYVTKGGDQGKSGVMTVYFEGEAHNYTISDKDLFRSINGMSTPDNSLVKALNNLKKMIQRFIVNAPQFVVKNVSRDFASRYIIGRTSPFTDIKNAFGGKLSKEEVSSMFKAAGGGQFGYYSLDRKQTLGQLEQKNFETYHKTWINQLRKGWRWLKTRPQAGENLSRELEFAQEFKNAKKQKLSDYQAARYAAFRSRSLIDFAQGGRTIRLMDHYIPFLNASVQGLVAAAKSFKRSPITFVKRWVFASTIPTALEILMLASSDDEEKRAYQELPAYKKDFYWNFHMGEGEYFSLAKPFELGMLGSIATRWYMHNNGVDGRKYVGEKGKKKLKEVRGDDDAWEGFAGNYVRAFAPLIGEPHMIYGSMTGVVEAASNYNFWMGRNINPHYEEGFAWYHQKSQKSASAMGQGLGWLTTVDNKFLIKPKTIDNLTRSYFGYYGRMAMDLSDFYFKEQPPDRSLAENLFRGAKSLTGVITRQSYLGSRDLVRIYEMDRKQQPFIRKSSAHTSVMNKIKVVTSALALNQDESGVQLTDEMRHELGQGLFELTGAYRDLLEAFDESVNDSMSQKEKLNYYNTMVQVADIQKLTDF
ncbi:MAG: LPD38 domain-containing protein, partial [Fulvivirga sp.]|nr:LPD38 domain-containing protein [Fulvivirga sp.]